MTAEQEHELERVTRLRGFRYGLHDFLAEVDLNALKKGNDKVEAEYINAPCWTGRPRNCLSWRPALPKKMKSLICRCICMQLLKLGQPKKSFGLAFS
jgi:hypothetical protein